MNLVQHAENRVPWWKFWVKTYRGGYESIKQNQQRTVHEKKIVWDSYPCFCAGYRR